MITVRKDYADKQWLARCPDEAAEPFAWMMICAIACLGLWLFDLAIWSAP